MTNMLAAPNTLVKHAVDESVSQWLAAGYDEVVDLKGIPERIQWILDAHGWSERELGRRAGLSESHVGLILNYPEEQIAKIKIKTLVGIARAASVSLSWLALGEGPRERREATENEPFPERAEAVEMLQRLNVHPQVIDDLLEVSDEGKGRPLRWWVKKGLQSEELLRDAESLELVQVEPPRGPGDPGPPPPLVPKPTKPRALPPAPVVRKARRSGRPSK